MEKWCLPMLCNNIWVHFLSWTTAGNKNEIQTKMCLVFAYGCIFIQYLPCILINGLKMACLMHANLNYKWDLVYLPWLNIDSCLSWKQFFYIIFLMISQCFPSSCHRSSYLHAVRLIVLWFSLFVSDSMSWFMF